MLRNALEGALGDIRGCLATLDAETLTCADAAEILELATEIERAGAALKVLVAVRASQ